MSVWTEIAVGVTAGVGTGVLASTLTPWSQWGVDKQRQRRQARARIIEGARMMVGDSQDKGRSDILRDPRYMSIRPHLSQDVERELRQRSLVAVRDPYGTVGNYYLKLIHDEADRLEREWGLS